MPALASFVLAASVAFTGVQPQLAAVGDVVYLVFGQGNDISVARSTDGGQSFGPPASLPTNGRMALGMRRGPRIAATGRALLVAAVIGTRGGGADGDVVLYRSNNQGVTWAAPIVINDVPASAREGLQTIAASPSGLVVITWLDLRQGGTRIHAAVSRDHGATWAPDVLVYASPGGAVCECCHPSVALADDGRVAVMFRNNLEGNRDMYVAQSIDGRAFAPAMKLGTGTWTLNACPMDGGGLVWGAAGVHATWRREDVVFLTTPSVPERRLGPGRDPVIARVGDAYDVAWATAAGVVLERGDTVTPIGDGRFPSILALRNQTVVAWEDKGTVRVRTIPR